MEDQFKTFNHFKTPVEESFELPVEAIQIETSPKPVNQIKTPKALPAEVVSMLESRIGDEYTAHYTYRNAANWCKNTNYKKAAAYFEAEAASELEHAKSLQDYLTQWNIIPKIPAVSPVKNFNSLMHIIDDAYDMEYNLLMSYSDHQIDLIDLHPATHNFIQGFVDIQNEAVGEYSDLLNALCLINPNNKLDILYFEQTYF